ncbi:ribonuclease P protein subunit p14 isoform X1 [Vulpes lagopus]|uniref:ribonuclease P protein subunit p14 isoform X1 n=1 Tax=Vulpes lagopus TaxID=494514 RepID=UPI001BC97E7B|nr:ribonuclease P protein subunit p14 isoform X1 [Vulpes lagopus]
MAGGARPAEAPVRRPGGRARVAGGVVSAGTRPTGSRQQEVAATGVQSACARRQMWSALDKMPAPATTYERIVYRNPSEHHYMKVCLEFEDHGVGLNVAQFKQLLISALKDLFGEVAAALPLDVLTYEEKTLSAILRICSSGLVKLWSSLTLLGSYKGKKCAFRVIQVSPFLLALSGNSRELVLD